MATNSKPESASFRAPVSSGTVRAVNHSVSATSDIHFEVHTDMHEVQAYARSADWLDKGYTQLSIAWLALSYTTDGWKTTRTLKSTDVPSPIVNGLFHLPNVPRGTEVEFAIHVGLSCHSPGDTAGYRERGDFWLNNEDQNYRQTTR